jgi:hypothetical protein
MAAPAGAPVVKKKPGIGRVFLCPLAAVLPAFARVHATCSQALSANGVFSEAPATGRRLFHDTHHPASLMKDFKLLQNT